MQSNRLYFLFRRGKQEHIRALYDQGEVYINSIDFIRKCDDNEQRTDNQDGILSREYIGEAKITFCEVGKDLDKDGLTFDSSNVVINTDHLERGNIYCMTGIYSEHLTGERADFSFDTNSFGDSVIFIHNPKQFIERIFSALKDKGYSKFISNRVEYYSNHYSGSVGFFKKHERFKNQNEYRIFVPNKNDEVIKLKIGSLEKIAKLDTAILKLSYSDNKEQLIRL